MNAKLLLKICFFGVISICFHQISFAQTEEWQEALIESIIDQIEDDADVDYTELFERIENWVEHPLQINQVDYEDLSEIPFLNALEINAILQHRSVHGKLISLFELQAIPILSVEKAELLAQLCTVGSIEDQYQLSIPKMIAEAKNELFIKWRYVLEDQEGYIRDTSYDNRYLGNSHRYYTRYKLDYLNKLRIGFTMEKDAGESFFQGSNPYGFDFHSFHFYLKDYNPYIRAIAIGDYSISMGQGLIIHNNFGSGKSSNVLNIRKSSRVIKPFTSVDENNFYRGGAISIKPLKNISVHLFGSSKLRDVNLRIEEQDGDDPLVYFSSLLQSGYHRTPSEIEKEDQIRQSSVGGIIKLANETHHIAFNVLHDQYDKLFLPSNQVYNLYRPQSKTLINTSIDYGIVWRNLNLFGESAYSSNGGFAHLSNAIIALDRKVHMAVSYRYYQAQYYASLPNAFGDSQTASNEQGIYLGLDFHPQYRWTVSAYADFWKHPWLKFRKDGPSQGTEYLIKIRYYIKRKLEFYTQYNWEQKQENSDAEQVIPSIESKYLHRFRNHLSWKINPYLTWRTRVEISYFKKQEQQSNGFLMYQDFIYKPIGIPVSFTARYAIFDTDDYDSRIYAYENDILYEFYIPAFYQKGTKFYVNVRYDVTRNITAEFRYARTYLDNVDEIGSGLDLIDGQTKTGLKAQIKIKF